MLQSKLSLKCYLLPSSGNPIVVDYTTQMEGLSFTTVAPGGMGTLTANIRIPNMADPHPELALFARVALTWGTRDLWIGEITAPVYKTDTDEVYQLSALGIGNCLRDDPRRVSYSAQTLAQIITGELSPRSAYIPLSQDVSAIVPVNAGTTYSPVYDGRYAEEVIADVAQMDGDDHWGVWPHPTAKDAAGFAQGQLQLHQRDLTTISYRASFGAGEVIEQEVKPSADRAYNVIQIGYNDPSQYPPVGIVTYTDPRLNGDGSQGTAAFRRRLFYRDLSGITTVTKAVAQVIANTYGALYQNPTYASTWTLVAVNNAANEPIPLWAVQADHVVQVQGARYRANTQNQVSQLATTAQAGQQAFYIVGTTYTEDSGGKATLRLETDNFQDFNAVRLARLQLKADVQSRSANKTTGVVQALGAKAVTFAGVASPGSVAAGTVISAAVAWPAILSQIPTSVTFATTGSTNTTGPSFGNLTVWGFTISITATAVGTCSWFGSATSVGN
jgi:hypothetical protein